MIRRGKNGKNEVDNPSSPKIKLIQLIQVALPEIYISVIVFSLYES